MDNVVILNDRRPPVFKEATCEACQVVLAGYFPFTTTKLRKSCCGELVDFKTLKKLGKPAENLARLLTITKWGVFFAVAFLVFIIAKLL